MCTTPPRAQLEHAEALAVVFGLAATNHYVDCLEKQVYTLNLRKGKDDTVPAGPEDYWVSLA